jgi:hypothetical protein
VDLIELISRASQSIPRREGSCEEIARRIWVKRLVRYLLYCDDLHTAHTLSGVPPNPSGGRCGLSPGGSCPFQVSSRCPMQMTRLVCSQCNDPAEAVTPYNGSTLLASTSQGEIIVALHKRCESAWADRHNCRTLVPLKKMHQWNILPYRSDSGS